jgi:hypothetical protein
MKTKTRLAGSMALLAILLAITPAVPRTPQPEKDPRTPVPLTELIPLPDEKTVPWGPEVDGLSCRLVVTPQVVPGQPIRLTIQVRNNSKKTRYVLDYLTPLSPTQGDLNVTGPDGKRIKQTYSQGPVVDARMYKPIPAGEIRRFDLGNVRDLFVIYDKKEGECTANDGLAKEGKYSLVYTFRSPKCPERQVTGSRLVEKNGKQQNEQIIQETPKEVLEGAWSGDLKSNVTNGASSRSSAMSSTPTPTARPNGATCRPTSIASFRSGVCAGCRPCGTSRLSTSTASSRAFRWTCAFALAAGRRWSGGRPAPRHWTTAAPAA